MQTALPRDFTRTQAGQAAEDALRKCVHCGFCTATCPTYQLLGNELDSPRGRIYLMKAMLEGEAVTRTTQRHLDRCLTCRACETACPSGVRYARLLEIGRAEVDRRVRRPLGERLTRRALLAVVPHRRRFAALLRLARLFRGMLPRSLRERIPPAQKLAKPATGNHERRVILLRGCVQPALTPAVDIAATHLLKRLGYSVAAVSGETCCGAVSHHLSEEEQTHAFVRRNIDAWWPHVEDGAAAIIATASGCGLMLREYPQLFGPDDPYRAKAERVASLATDVCQLIDASDTSHLRRAPWAPRKIAFQAPCTLQHGHRLAAHTEAILKSLGFVLTEVPDAYRCCGSAGTYSLLQPVISEQLRERKLADLMTGDPDLIATANVGCHMHLGAVSTVPVHHWVELIQ